MTALPARATWMRIVFGSDPRRTLRRTALSAILIILVARFVWMPIRLTGISMEPTYRDGAIRVANLLRYVRRDPARGDVVVIAMTGRGAFYLKRVIGLPGEHVEFRHGELWINGRLTPEPYVVRNGRWTIAESRVGTNEYFVAGDNREMPAEWHTLGLVSRDKIAGGILF